MTSSSRSLTTQLATLGVIILLLIGIFIAATYWFTERIEGEATRINEAGRLRYRSFEIATILQEFAAAGPGAAPSLKTLLEERLSAFSDVLHHLRKGDHRLGFGPLSGGENAALLAAIVEEWETTIRPEVARTPASLREFNERIRSFVGKIDIFVDNLDAENRDNIRSFAGFRIIAFAFFVLLFAVVIYSVRKHVVLPLRRLRSAIATVEKGDLSAQVSVSAERDHGELARLSLTFNDMVRAINAQSAQTDVLMRELEVKNRELGEVNRQLLSSKEQLEVAYEEAQTQSEELESGNEELQILNEDLDRKTKDLLETNNRLREEEERVRRTMTELQTIFDGINDSIAFFDTDFNVVKANKAFRERFSLPEGVSQRGKCYTQLMQRDTVCERCLVAETYRTNRPVSRETRVSGGRIVQAHTFPIKDRERLVGVVEYIKDVTDQRVLEQQLIQTEKLTSLGEMISGVAHELNNPLTVIVGFAELIMRQEIPPPLRESLAKIHGESLRSKKIIENVLHFSRRRPAERVLSDINALLRQIVDIREYDIKTSNVEIVAELDPAIPRIAVDPNRIQQVFLNIVNNALQAILEKKREGRIVVATSLVGGVVTIAFTDDGPGIAPEHIDRIFDPFFTTKEVGKGTGLGLSISYTIVKEHGGALTVSSPPGEGATLTVTLPVDAQESPKRETERRERTNVPSTPAAGRDAALSILVIDDEPMILELLKLVLEQDGHTVETASTGGEAIARLEAKRYDILISDIKMPDMSGHKLIDTISKRDPDIVNRVLLMSGDIFQTEEPGERTLPRLSKPFTIQALKAAVAELLRRT
ncbi:MAG: hypothetical protein A2Z34_03920 [Planctomycetes bacterium RBG_16_59_8]|nr:MAG: hypothetical protein A2Z34_03920 [Planctomycetes bacterium RBG_16_59_8]